jgi:hypothetical protein
MNEKVFQERGIVATAPAHSSKKTPPPEGGGV